MEQINKRTLTCHKCKYSWATKSKMLLVSCPRCGVKTKTETTELKHTPDVLPIAEEAKQ